MKQEFEENSAVIQLLKDLKSMVEKVPDLKFYRNKDLRRIFGLSDNTIISYRDKNILPYSKLGDVYLYPIDEIKQLLNKSGNCEYFNR